MQTETERYIERERDGEKQRERLLCVYFDWVRSNNWFTCHILIIMT